jgi:predicted  nucleic acid-binding Zn-ribbon protein
MLEQQDIQKLMDVLATKDDIRGVTSRLDTLEETLGSLMTTMDRMIGRLEALHQEYLVLKERDSRYERWFKEIADKVGITLVP